MSTAFLSIDPSLAGLPALSPFRPDLQRAGANFETRDGWEIATGFGDPTAEATALGTTVGWADRSQLGKLELQGTAATVTELRSALSIAEPEPGHFGSAATSLWLPLTPQRALVVCEPGDVAGLSDQFGAAALDVSSNFAAMTIAGPLARDVFARFCALDLRPRETPVGALRPGSVARVPGFVLREAADLYTVIFGAAYASYFWEVVSDAGERFGGRPVGADALSQATAQEHADA